MDIPNKSQYKDFELLSNLGADDSMIDYTKMAILLSFQKQYDTAYKKYEIIRKKFENEYGGIWAVCLFQNCLSDVSACYKEYCLIVKYNGIYFKIFKLR